jgi:hypothetical protein
VEHPVEIKTPARVKEKETNDERCSSKKIKGNTVHKMRLKGNVRRTRKIKINKAGRGGSGQLY